MKTNQLKMVGGAAESPIWPQIVDDVTNMPVILPEVKQAASCGAAIKVLMSVLVTKHILYPIKAMFLNTTNCLSFIERFFTQLSHI